MARKMWAAVFYLWSSAALSNEAVIVGNALAFSGLTGGYKTAQLTVTGEDLATVQRFRDGESIRANLADLPDGIFHYELRVSHVDPRSASKESSGPVDHNGRSTQQRRSHQSGTTGETYFGIIRVERGAAFLPETAETMPVSDDGDSQ